MSHHYDSPTAIEDGRLNLLDLYVFPEAPGTTTLVVGVNPDAGRSSPATFRADALYEFVIASDEGRSARRYHERDGAIWYTPARLPRWHCQSIDRSRCR